MVVSMLESVDQRNWQAILVYMVGNARVTSNLSGLQGAERSTCATCSLQEVVTVSM